MEIKYYNMPTLCKRTVYTVLFLKYRKIPKISPGAYIFQRMKFLTFSKFFYVLLPNYKFVSILVSVFGCNIKHE